MKNILLIILNLFIWPLALVSFGISGSFLLLALLIFPARHLHHLIRVISRFILLSAGQILVVKRDDKHTGMGPFIYMFNHESMFDAFMVGAIVPHYVTAVAADYQFDYPIWGSLLRRYGIIPIERKNLKNAVSSLSKAEDALLEGKSFFVAPEGTRTVDGNLREFKKGPFHVARNTGATIIPIGFRGGFRAKPKFRRLICPGILSARVGQPISQSEYRDLSVVELRDLTRRKIQDLLIQKEQ